MSVGGVHSQTGKTSTCLRCSQTRLGAWGVSVGGVTLGHQMNCVDTVDFARIADADEVFDRKQDDCVKVVLKPGKG